ncbi:Mth938-like domain-containing protein [Kordiimonas lipolytica]|uniref:Mth938-like domain-containing protein n=1 Tax=Kordiimonas lipolytica TaxID=1662421 RepID=A0ABV8U8W0_9PROT|nr:MTH938/NDUFAF3 family protein [Kordiimonas lipolytica]
MADKIRQSGFIMEQQADEDLLLIEAYGDGGFRLMERRVEGGVLVLPTGFYPMDAETLADLTPAHFSKIVDEAPRPEIVLVGTGAKMQLLPAAIREHLEAANIGYDIMDTGAAARTYNVLLMEQRRVACVLLPVD